MKQQIEWRAPTTYMGNKSRIAGAILDVIQPSGPLIDMCCGSGAIAIEAIRRGTSPADVTMIDDSPWGDVWSLIGEGTLSLAALRRFAKELGEDPTLHHDALRCLAGDPYSPELFLVLQAGAFGSKPVTHDGRRWLSPGWMRWDPRRGGLKPRAETIIARCAFLQQVCGGVKAMRADVRTHAHLVRAHHTVYIDPPYVGCTGYQLATNVGWADWGCTLPAASVWLSDSIGYRDGAIDLTAAAARKSTGVGGVRVSGEWLSKLV